MNAVLGVVPVVVVVVDDEAPADAAAFAAPADEAAPAAPAEEAVVAEAALPVFTFPVTFPEFRACDCEF